MLHPQLIIGNKNYSSWSLRPWLVLKHLNIEFEELRLPLSTDSFKQQIKIYSEAGKVPVFKNNDMTLWDSLAICEHLAEQHPDLWPRDPIDRALARCAVAEMHSGLNALRNELPMNCRARQRKLGYSAQAANDIARVQALWSQCRQQTSEEGPWLFGRFSIADAFFAPVAIRFSGYRIPLDANAKAYIDTQLGNPDLQQWIKEGKAEAEVIDEDEAGED